MWKNTSTRIHIQGVPTFQQNGEIPVGQWYQLHQQTLEKPSQSLIVHTHSIKSQKSQSKRTMKKIRHSDKTIKWHEAIQIAAHYYNTFPSASNGHSLFLLHFGRECSNPLWNKLNPGNTMIRQGDITTSVHELHKLWKAHVAEIKRNRSKNDNPKIDKDPPLKIGDRVLIMNYNSHGLDPKFFGDWKVWKFNSD